MNTHIIMFIWCIAGYISICIIGIKKNKQWGVRSFFLAISGCGFLFTGFVNIYITTNNLLIGSFMFIILCMLTILTLIGLWPEK